MKPRSSLDHPINPKSNPIASNHGYFQKLFNLLGYPKTGETPKPSITLKYQDMLVYIRHSESLHGFSRCPNVAKLVVIVQFLLYLRKTASQLNPFKILVYQQITKHPQTIKRRSRLYLIYDKLSKVLQTSKFKMVGGHLLVLAKASKPAFKFRYYQIHSTSIFSISPDQTLTFLNKRWTLG